MESSGEVKQEERSKRPHERFSLNEPCTVKLVYVDADKRLSLRHHNQKSEFWKVVKGPVKVEVGKETNTLQTVRQ